VPGVCVTIEFKRLLGRGMFGLNSLSTPLAFELEFESQAAVGFGTLTTNRAGQVVSGVLLLNMQGADGNRQVLRGLVAGTYSVDSDGMVTMNLTFSLPNGASVQGAFDLIVTDADEGNGKQLCCARARKLMGSPRGFFDVFVSDPGSKTLQRMPRRRVNRIIMTLTCDDQFR
jgi:hypothetical protein